jgi:hypothetical protein
MPAGKTGDRCGLCTFDSVHRLPGCRHEPHVLGSREYGQRHTSRIFRHNDDA